MSCSHGSACPLTLPRPWRSAYRSQGAWAPADKGGGDGMASLTVPDELVAGFNGRLVGPDDPQYDEVRAVHNGLIDRHPGLIARCHNVADVRDAVRFGRSAGLEISVRGGGHNVA